MSDDNNNSKISKPVKPIADLHDEIDDIGVSIAERFKELLKHTNTIRQTLADEITDRYNDSDKFTQDVGDLQTRLAQEIATRIQNDADERNDIQNLDNALRKESKTRHDEDEYLQGEVDKLRSDLTEETRERKDEDEHEQEEIDATNGKLNQEIDDRKKKNIEHEATEAGLRKDLTTETEQRIEADKILQQHIDTTNTNLAQEIKDRIKGDADERRYADNTFPTKQGGGAAGKWHIDIYGKADYAGEADHAKDASHADLATKAKQDDLGRRFVTTYPTMDGTGAHGKWNIDISGDANTVDGLHGKDLARNDHLQDPISIDGNTPASALPSGMSWAKVSNNFFPCNYGNVINIRGAGAVQYCIEWSGNTGGIGSVWWRNARDCALGVWSPWRRVYASDETVDRAHNDDRGNNIFDTYATKVALQHLIDSFHWSGQSGQPTWVWGGNSKNDYYVWNPSNFRVNHAANAGALDECIYVNSNSGDSWNAVGGNNRAYLHALRINQTPNSNWLQGNYSAGISFGGGDTKGVISMAYGFPSITFAGGNGDKPVWGMTIAGAANKLYNFEHFHAESADTALRSYNDQYGRNIDHTYFKKSGGTITGNVDCWGEIKASRVWNAVWNDYAEFFEKGEEVEPGDIVALDMDADEEHYVKATASSNVVVGVCSNEYGHILGGEAGKTEEENKKKFIPVSLMGRVHVKVMGSVKPGDRITVSNVPGVGRKAEAGEHIIGTAVTKAKNGLVRMIVNL